MTGPFRRSPPPWTDQELLSIFENVSVFLKAPQVSLEQVKRPFGHPTCRRPQPSIGLCGLSVAVRRAAPRQRVPRRGEDRFRNPFIKITRKGQKQVRGSLAIPTR